MVLVVIVVIVVIVVAVVVRWWCGVGLGNGDDGIGCGCVGGGGGAGFLSAEVKSKCWASPCWLLLFSSPGLVLYWLIDGLFTVLYCSLVHLFHG